MTYRILDLFCGAGGAAMGYSRAGFEVVGVDVNPQPRYPFEFIQTEALYLLECIASDDSLMSFDAIHASPPCQHFSIMSACVPGTREKYPDLIEPVRDLLISTGLPYVIENVVGAPLKNPLILCGSSFGLEAGGLQIRRHRLFETSFSVQSLDCAHAGRAMNPHNQRGRDRMYEVFGREDPEKHWANAMGVEWMSRHEARESIPPAYTEYIGKQLMARLNSTSNQAA